MDNNSYGFSKYLSFMFYQYRTAVSDWRDRDNQFKHSVTGLIDEYSEFMSGAIKNLSRTDIYEKGSEVVDEELKNVENLNNQWLNFIKKFSDLENGFIEKYKIKLSNPQTFAQDKEAIKDFLSEYTSYIAMESIYQSVIDFGNQINRYKETCLKYEKQSQPGEN